MDSVKYTEIAAWEDMEKGIEFCRKQGILPGEHFKDCGEVELSDTKFPRWKCQGSNPRPHGLSQTMLTLRSKQCGIGNVTESFAFLLLYLQRYFSLSLIGATHFLILLIIYYIIKFNSLCKIFISSAEAFWCHMHHYQHLTFWQN